MLHLDTVHFLPGWVERPLDEENAIVRRFLDTHESWIIDGNYTKTCYDRRLEEADQIIVLCFGRFTCLSRVLKRWWKNRGKVRSSSAPGCEEKIDAEFLWWSCIRAGPPPNWPDTGALVSNIRKSLFFSKIKASLNDF